VLFPVLSGMAKRPIPDVQAILTRLFGFMSDAVIAGLLPSPSAAGFRAAHKSWQHCSPHIKNRKQTTSMAPIAGFARRRARSIGVALESVWALDCSTVLHQQSHS
jgi:hypothetical protein